MAQGLSSCSPWALLLHGVWDLSSLTRDRPLHCKVDSYPLDHHRSPSTASLVAQMVKNLPEMGGTRVWSIGWEDPLEKGMATHSSLLAWRIPWTEEPGGLQSMGLQRVRHDLAINTLLGYNWHRVKLSSARVLTHVPSCVTTTQSRTDVYHPEPFPTPLQSASCFRPSPWQPVTIPVSTEWISRMPSQWNLPLPLGGCGCWMWHFHAA